MNLAEIKNNQTVIIKSLGNVSFLSKLYEYGMVPGAKIKILNKAAFNGPIYLELETYRFAIRKEEATFIEVE